MIEAMNTSPPLRRARASEPRRMSKPCACGRVHDADGWHSLPYLGLMRYEEHAFELRNCACGSTLCLEVPRERA